MGRGDKRSKKGKRFKGSFGKCRPQKVKSAFSKVAVAK
jgi:30S ribosomal protein S31